MFTLRREAAALAGFRVKLPPPQEAIGSMTESSIARLDSLGRIPVRHLINSTSCSVGEQIGAPAHWIIARGGYDFGFLRACGRPPVFIQMDFRRSTMLNNHRNVDRQPLCRPSPYSVM